MKREFVYISVLVLLVLMFFNSPFEIKRKSLDTIKIDSVEVVKVITEYKKEFVQVKPKPIYITKTNDKQLKNIISKLEKKYSQKADSVIILREYIQAIKVRKYSETFEDSLLVATFKAETTGTLNSIDFKYTKKPQKINYFKKTITKTLTPKFSLLGGGKINASSSLDNSSFEANIGAQFKNMDILEIGYDTNNSWSVGYKFNIFAKY